MYENLNYHEETSPGSDVQHNFIYGQIILVNSIGATYIDANITANLLNALNERNSANQYARRYQFISILRDLQSPAAIASVRPGPQESPSDLTCADGEDTHNSNRKRRTLRRTPDVGPAPLFDLAAMEQQEPAAAPAVMDNTAHGHVGLPLSGDDSTATAVQQFLQGDFDALREVPPRELLNRLAANPTTLHQLLVVPDDPGRAQEPDGSSGARAGNSNDFSQGPTAEQGSDGLA